MSGWYPRPERIESRVLIGNPSMPFPMVGYPRPNMSSSERKKDFFFTAGLVGMLQRREVDNVAFNGTMRVSVESSPGSVICTASGYRVPMTAAVKVDGRWYAPQYAPTPAKEGKR